MKNSTDEFKIELQSNCTYNSFRVKNCVIHIPYKIHLFYRNLHSFVGVNINWDINICRQGKKQNFLLNASVEFFEFFNLVKRMFMASLIKKYNEPFTRNRSIYINTILFSVRAHYA